MFPCKLLTDWADDEISVYNMMQAPRRRTLGLSLSSDGASVVWGRGEAVPMKWAFDTTLLQASDAMRNSSDFAEWKACFLCFVCDLRVLFEP
ncbi:hypothetical protein LIA77_05282 [Sarocladium implicatum]|jgi:hypothetical protein|nr:hypothetical protein LIA77_05282 [Sarocladium implicatum]